MRVRIEVSRHADGFPVYVETVGVVLVGQMIEEIAHTAAHVKYHFRRGRTQHIHHVPAHFMRGEELSHLKLLLRFGVFVVIGEIGLPEVVKPSDAGVAVIDALRRNEVLAGVYGEKYLLVDLGTHTLRYLLGNDGIHILSVVYS